MSGPPLRCSRCRSRADDVDGRLWRCPCGGPLDLEFVPSADRASLEARPPGPDRHRAILPLPRDAEWITFDEGPTPLLAERIEGRPVRFKLDYLLPTGSYKDRGASLLVSRARMLGAREILDDSSGNAGCALAGHAARAGITAHILVPRTAASPKMAQIRAFGGRLREVDGDREAVARRARDEAHRLHYASHNWSPWFLHGVKTVAYEIHDQLDGRFPSALVVPAGSGGLLLGAWIGFRELSRPGARGRLPALFGVQAEACAPLAGAFETDSAEPVPVVPGRTRAEGARVADPPRGRQVLRAVRDSGGRILSVDEASLEDALQRLGRRGLHVEPTSALALAGYLRLSAGGLMPPGEVVVILTGSGLKAANPP